MAEKFLQQGAAGYDEVEFKTTSAGAGDAGKPVALNGDGKIDETMLSDDLGSASYVRVAAESLTNGDIVDVFVDSGTTKARRADATTTGKPARGFVQDNYDADDDATIYGPGQVITGLTGITPGATYYLSTTPGAITTTPPAATNNSAQPIGWGISDTEVMFQPGPIVKRA